MGGGVSLYLGRVCIRVWHGPQDTAPRGFPDPIGALLSSQKPHGGDDALLSPTQVKKLEVRAVCHWGGGDRTEKRSHGKCY